MIENIIICFIIAALIKTTNQRSYLGFLVLSYYAIFILVDLDYYGLNQLGVVFTDNAIEWSTFMILISLLYAFLSLLLYASGSNIAGLYCFWLITNAAIILVEAIDTNNAFIIDLIYNITQNTNLIIDLLVVILGTDNILHRISGSGKVISNCNNYINRANCLFTKLREKFKPCQQKN